MKIAAEILIMASITYIGVKYLIDMIRYSKGYRINGKCRYGKEYADQLEESLSDSPVNTISYYEVIDRSEQMSVSAAFHAPDEFDEKYIVLSFLLQSA